MPVTFQIMPDRGLVYIKYSGTADVSDSIKAFGEYAQHPDCKPGQKQLVDLSRVTDMEPDFVKLMEHQAQKADLFMGSQSQTLIVYFVTNKVTLNMAQMISNSWEPFPWVVPVIMDNEADVMDFLGLPERRFEEILA